jgi:hypothetical protein
MKEKREGGDRDRAWWGKRERTGGFWPTGHPLPFSPPTNQTEAGEGSRGRPAGANPQQTRPRRRMGGGAKRRGRRGGSIPVLTLSWGGAGRWIGGRRQFACWRLWWRRGGVQGGLWRLGWRGVGRRGGGVGPL